MAEQIRYGHYLHGGDYNPEQWLDRPDILKKDIEYFKKAHINTVSMGMFSWAVLEPEEGKYNFDWLEAVINNLYKEGIYTILSTPSGARPKWMADKYEEVLRMDPDRTRRFFGGRHNHCYTSPVYREKVYNINKKLSERFGKHPAVLLWHISNEYGGECHCPLCREKFREWLKEKYGTIENLNSSWCTTFWSHTYNSFDQIESPSPKGENALHALTLDWKRFVTDRTVDFMKHEISAIRAGGSELPATANLMYDYNGLDYKKFKDVMDIASWDNYPSWHKKDNYTTALDGAMQHDLMRSIKKAPFLLMESCPSATNWKPINKLKKPGIHLAASLQAVAHGSDSVLYFQLRQSQGASEKFHGAVIDHYGVDDTRIFREVTEVGEALEQIRETAGSVTKSPVAVLYDRENDWALKDAHGPRNEDMHYQENVLKQYRALRRKGYNTDIINMEHELSRYRLVTAPMAYMFYHGYAEKLRAFAKNGGTLVISYWSGLVDETDKCYLEGTPHGLMEAAGIRTEEIDALYDWEENVGIPETGNHLRITESYTCKNLCELAKVSDAEVLLRYGRDFYQGYPVLTHKKYGKGHVYYVAADMEAAFYEDFLGRAAEEAGVKMPLTFIPEGISVTTRENKDTEYLFNQDIYDSLTPEQQQVVDEAGQKAVEYERYINRSGDEEIMSRWEKSNGVTFTKKEDMDIDSFKKAVDGIDDWFVKELKSEGYDDAQDLVDLFTEDSVDTVEDYSDLNWPETTWNFACSTTETSTWADGGRKFGELMEKATGGKIKVNVYAADQLTNGNQSEGIQALMNGDPVQISMHSNLIYSAFDPRFNVVSLPFIYDSYDDADAKFDGEAGDKLKEILNGYGLHCMGIAENGFRELTNSKHEVKSVDDMKNLKVRVAGSNLLMECYKRWGADATNMNWSETYTALQQNTVEGEENPLPAIDAASVQEVQPYCSMWDAIYDCLFFCINQDIYDALTPEQQAVVDECGQKAVEYERYINRSSDDEIKARWADKNGVTFTEKKDMDIDSFKKAVDGVDDWFVQELKKQGYNDGQDLVDLFTK